MSVSKCMIKHNGLWKFSAQDYKGRLFQPCCVRRALIASPRPWPVLTDWGLKTEAQLEVNELAGLCAQLLELLGLQLCAELSDGGQTMLMLPPPPTPPYAPSWGWSWVTALIELLL